MIAPTRSLARSNQIKPNHLDPEFSSIGFFRSQSSLIKANQAILKAGFPSIGFFGRVARLA
jgi:hypothetical protein